MFHGNYMRSLFYLTFSSLIMLIMFPSLLTAETGKISISDKKPSLKTILENAEEFIDERERASEIRAIWDLDVFDYFNLYDKYDTPLKREVFKKSSEYKEKLNELKAKKQEIQKKIYYITLPGTKLEPYNVGKKGFELNFDVEYVHFPSLPVRIIKTPFLETYWWLFLPWKGKEEDALYIENNRDKIKIFLIFPISDVRAVPGYWGKTIVANSVRVIVANEETDEIYFDRVWSSRRK